MSGNVETEAQGGRYLPRGMKRLAGSSADISR